MYDHMIHVQLFYYEVTNIDHLPGFVWVRKFLLFFMQKKEITKQSPSFMLKEVEIKEGAN